MSLSRVRIIIRPRDVVRSVIRFRSNTIVTRLKAPSVELPVRCTLYCPSEEFLGNSELSFRVLGRVAFRRPSEGAFGNLPVTIRTTETNNDVPAIFGTTGRLTIHGFLRGGVDFLSVCRVVKRSVDERATMGSPSLSRVLRVRGRACH